MMIETRYKILTGNQTSPYRGQKYRRRKWYHEPHIGKAGKNGCVRGLYAVPVEGLLYRGLWRDDEHAYECRVRGQQAGESPLKECWEHLQVIRRLDEHEVRSLARAEHDRLWYLLEDALYPLHPLRIERGPVTSGEIESLWQWASVRDSVGDSVRDSVWDSVRASVRDSVGASVGASVRASVRDSVRDSVRASVRDNVRASVRDSVWAYTGSIFPVITDWKYIDHEPGVYPFQAGADLWRAGLVPSFDGKVWRLHGGPDGRVVWES